FVDKQQLLETLAFFAEPQRRRERGYWMIQQQLLEACDEHGVEKPEWLTSRAEVVDPNPFTRHTQWVDPPKKGG
ncbi:MAG: hypothetical protein ACE5JJ_09255, partial [Nitrospinota bacterium]